MRKKRRSNETPYERVALVLQGGGSLGMYQVGVFEALCEAGYAPGWIAGTSIGAINAAIMAGNAPDERIAKLEAFWETISRDELWTVADWNGELRRLRNSWSSLEAVTLGQPGFFRPRLVNPWLAPPATRDAVSYYDTRPLLDTLHGLVDLERLNGGGVRISVGAVKVTTGAPVYFDSARRKIGYEHIMASGALPPGFPPVEVEGELYWDGGIFSNTPLEAVLDDEPRVSTLCFMVDLFNPVGPAPRTMDDVLARHKDIIYASRTHRHIDSYRRTHNLRRAVMALWNDLPREARTDSELQRLAGLGCTTTMFIEHFIYRSQPSETAAKDYEFSKASIAEHRAAGCRDAKRALDDAAWRDPPPANVGVIVHQAASVPA